MTIKKKLIITAICGIAVAPAWILNPGSNVEQQPAQRPTVATLSALTKEDGDNTPPTASLPAVSEENAEIGTHITTPAEIHFEPLQPSDAQRDNTTPAPATTQLPQPQAPTEPRMGDTRIIDGQKQVYFLGFGWIEDNDEPNMGIYAEDIYENSNKIGSMGGKGPSQISKQLEVEQIPTPAQFYYQKHGVMMTGFKPDTPYQWEQATVAKTLENEVYLGHTINLKYTTVSFKNKKRIKHPENEQVRIENTHASLIDKTTWDIVQDIRKHKRRRANMEEQNIFSGLIYCKDFGGTLVLHRAHTMDAIKNNFMCSTYKKKGKDVCTAHYIRESQLVEILLDDLRQVTHFARQNERLFAKHITQKNSTEIRKKIAQTERELEAMRRRDTELAALFKRLYEDNVLGKIPNEVFRKLSDDYLVEQKEIQSSIPKQEERLEKLKGSVANVGVFLDKARQYTEINELTAELLHLFIERVEIGERGEKWSRTALQEVDIYYRDIGLLDNAVEETVERIAEQEPEQSTASPQEVA